MRAELEAARLEAVAARAEASGLACRRQWLCGANAWVACGWLQVSEAIAQKARIDQLQLSEASCLVACLVGGWLTVSVWRRLVQERERSAAAAAAAARLEAEAASAQLQQRVASLSSELSEASTRLQAAEADSQVIVNELVN